MKIAIVEDEAPAARMLQELILELLPEARIIASLSSLTDAILWFSKKTPVDLIFMDIALGDGLSLEIFERSPPDCPVIFVTAYDQYWQEAFEHNGIDYLLKPLRKERLELALRKFDALRGYFQGRLQRLAAWRAGENQFKDRFLVKKGQKFVSLMTKDIAYFFSSHKMTFLVDASGVKYALDDSLVQLETQVDPKFFFRINRKYLVHLNSIANIRALPKSKLVIAIKPEVQEDLIVSSENSAAFKRWMGQ
jgi:DNA-binding LytR/AlgR family response regulator